jgi:ABC-2 type transport system permease protein
MINQILAVLWKEWQELFQQRGLRGGLFNWLILVVLGGIFVPLQTGEQWFTQPYAMLVWSWIPMLAVMQIVADTFAGERERHTLETLLASKLSDSAILWGKVFYVVLYGWSIEFSSLILAAVSINVVHWQGTVQFYSINTLVGIVPVSMFLVGLIAGIGTLVSLRSGTVRGAYQKLMIGFMVVLFGGSASR